MNRFDGTRFARLAATALLGSLAAVSASNAQALGNDNGDKWQFVFAPYVMGASLDGTAIVQGREADVDLSASDIFDHLDYGGMAAFGARKGNWGVMGDVLWVRLEVESDMPPGEFAPTLGVVELQGLRRLGKNADLTLGARWNHLKGELRLDAPFSIKVERTKDWVDPIVGFVLHTSGERRWHATLVANAGGFGVGSDLSWELFPSFGVNLGKHVSLEAGWRFLDTDYEDGDGLDRFEYDVMLQGPVAGIAFRF
jgi:hypothetical protein